MAFPSLWGEKTETKCWNMTFEMHTLLDICNKKVNEMSSLRQHRICVLGISTLGNLLVKVSYHSLHKVLRTEINTRSVAFVYVVIFCLQSRRITQENRS